MGALGSFGMPILSRARLGKRVRRRRVDGWDRRHGGDLGREQRNAAAAAFGRTLHNGHVKG